MESENFLSDANYHLPQTMENKLQSTTETFHYPQSLEKVTSELTSIKHERSIALRDFIAQF